VNDFANQTGMEYLQELIRSGRSSPMASLLNMRLIEVSDGKAVFEAFPSAQFYNPQERVHGGFMATLLDSALGCAVQTKLARGVGYGTIELKVNYVRKVVADTGRLICTATVLHAGRTMLTSEGKVASPDGKLYAHGSGTFLVFP
jgi:acyl-CoA thioesterase